jgi:hypothetical protein
LHRERKVSVIANTIFICALAAARVCAVRLNVGTRSPRRAPGDVPDERLTLCFTANQKTNTNIEAGLRRTRAKLRALRGASC